MQTDHVSNRLAGSAVLNAVAVGKRRIESWPLAVLGQHNEGMARIEDLIEVDLKQLKLIGLDLPSWSHNEPQSPGSVGNRSNTVQSVLGFAISSSPVS